MLPSIGVLGLGYVGKTLLSSFQWPETSWYTVFGSDQVAKITSKISPVPFDWSMPETWENLPDSSCQIILTIPPLLSNIEQEKQRLEEWVRWMTMKRKNIDRLIYISSTGVYPNINGNWSEDDHIAPDTVKGQIRLATEGILAVNLKTIIIRAGAIYGPERHIGQRLQKGKPIPSSDQPVHRIHIADLVRIIRTVVISKTVPGIINAVDLHPAPSIEVVGWLLRQPAYTSLANKANINNEFKTRKHSQTAPGRHIDNDNLTKNLNFKFKYPTYREGLADTL